MQTSEPGAARYGNFINYYDFNPATTRTKLIEESITEYVKNLGPEPLYLLDIGCNAGDLSLAIYQMASAAASHREVHMLAVDLDPILIERAREKNTEPLVQFKVMDITNPTQREAVVQDFFPLGCEPKFDFVFCFSTTMWIHLNHGDSALTDLLTTSSNYGDNIIIEPQPWKCYRNAMRRMRRTNNHEFPLFSQLTIREDVVNDIMRILTDRCHLQLRKHLGFSDWNRPVLWYTSVLNS